MKSAINFVLALAIVSLVLGVISRLTMVPIPLSKGGIEAEAFLMFTNTCLLTAIALSVLQITKSKQ